MTDAERLADFAADLGGKIEQALPGWVELSVLARLGTPTHSQQAEPHHVTPKHVTAAKELGLVVLDHAGPQLRSLLSQDIDQQRSTPLTVLRGVVPHMTSFLEELGVAAPGRDGEARRLHPDDVYDLTPGGYEDFGDDVRQASLMWGAAKAHVHIQRRKSEGLR